MKSSGVSLTRIFHTGEAGAPAASRLWRFGCAKAASCRRSVLSAFRARCEIFGLTLVLATAVGSVPLAARPESGDVTESGKRFVDLLAKEDFAGAFAQFDPKVKQALPEPKLRETWQALQAQNGPFKKTLAARAEKQMGYDIVLVTCEFARATLDTKVVFDAKRQVAGLFFVPTRPAAAATPPPYARTNAFREQPLTVGSGQWALPGTLSVPTAGGPWPALVLVHGSGPQDRDETLGANKPFRDLAWGLATRGIAVLRYEKRTKEHGLKLMANLHKLTLQEETIDDALSAAARLRATAGLDAKRIFVLGHSLGGLAVPRIGKADPQLAGLIILAGSTRPLEDMIVEQVDYLVSLDASKAAEAIPKVAEIKAEVAKVKKLTAADASSTNLLLGAPVGYWLDLRAYDAPATARTLKQPLLILQGQRDYQVTQADFDGWKKALGASPNVTFKLYPTLNHLFIAGEGKSTPDEYEQSGHVAETVVADIAAWMLATNSAGR